jgi:hypothetical protein
MVSSSPMPAKAALEAKAPVSAMAMAVSAKAGVPCAGLRGLENAAC